MKSLVSKEPIWLDKSDAILALSGKPIRLIYPDGIERETRVLIQHSPTNEQKIGATVWILAVPSDTPFCPVVEGHSQQFEDMPQITLFFTPTTLELLLRQIASHPESELLLDLRPNIQTPKSSHS